MAVRWQVREGDLVWSGIDANHLKEILVGFDVQFLAIGIGSPSWVV